MDLELVCPYDRASLELVDAGAAFRCPGCGLRYPVVQGVVRFAEEHDAFYEAHYADWQPTRFAPKSNRFVNAWPLWLIKSGWFWAMRKHIPAGSVVLEVGCGAGSSYFGQRWRMIGLDVAHTSLIKVVPLYDTCIQVDSEQDLPLADGSVDAIVNSFLWEHLDAERKRQTLREWRRVLRPGGKLVLLYDLDSGNPLVRAMRKRNEALYRRLFIENEHHWGYQTLDENRVLFEQGGFRMLEHRGKQKTWILSASTYDKVQHFGGWLQRISRMGLRFNEKPLLFPYMALVRVIDEFVGPFLPMNWSLMAVTVCERSRD
jgi:SAM-dependent methyltransferase